MVSVISASEIDSESEREGQGERAHTAGCGWWAYVVGVAGDERFKLIE